MSNQEILALAAQCLLDDSDLSRKAMADLCEENGLADLAAQVRQPPKCPPGKMHTYRASSLNSDRRFDVSLDIDGIVRLAASNAARNGNGKSTLLFSMIRAKEVK